MPMESTTTLDGAQRRAGPWTRRAITALAAVTVLASMLGATSIADALARASALGVGIGIAALCCAGCYLIHRAALDGAARQFGYAWRERTR